MAQINQNMSGVETQEGFEPLKAGWYEAVVQDSEIKEGPSGPYINWTFGIVGHPNKVWDIMSLGNKVSIQRLKTLCHCCGHPNPNYMADTEEIHGKHFLARLKIEVDESGQYDPKNRVSAFKALQSASNPVAATIAPSGAAAPEQQATGHVPPGMTPTPQPAPQQEQSKMPWE